MVNVNDVSVESIPQTGCRLANIFNRQEELMIKYKQIERDNGFYVPTVIPINIDDRHDQNYLKNMAWRVAEEITEATEAYRIHATDPMHFREELMDALHFLVEMNLLIGMYPDHIAELPMGAEKDRLTDLFEEAHSHYRVDSRHLKAYEAIEAIGIAMNFLKLKPWKVSHVHTDRKAFENQMVTAFKKFVLLLVESGMTSDDVYDLYFRKSEVNKFRQRSGY